MKNVCYLKQFRSECPEEFPDGCTIIPEEIQEDSLGTATEREAGLRFDIFESFNDLSSFISI